MSLLNLTPAGGSGSGQASYDTLDDLADRMARRKKKQEDELAASTAAQQQQKQPEQASKPQKQEGSPPPAPSKKNFLQKVGSGVADVFQANTEGDKQRRAKAGQAVDYHEQQAEKKRSADFYNSKPVQEALKRGETFSFTPGDLNIRREHYKASGVDIDQLFKDKQIYDKFKKDFKGQSLAKLTLEKKIPAEAQRYERDQKKAKSAESAFQRNVKAQSGAENVFEQAERGFVRGVGEPVASLPGNLETAAGATLQAVAPSGSRIQKVGDKVYKEAKDTRDDLARRIVSSGYAPAQNDNQLVAGVSGGAGSLITSLTPAGMTKKGPAIAASIFGLNAGADQTVAAKDAGVNDIGSLLIGFGSGLTEAALEQFGIEKFLGATGTPVKQALTRMVTEGTQEAAQSLAQSGYKAMYSDVDLTQAITQAAQEGGMGAFIGGSASLPMTVAQQLENKGVDHQTAAQIGVDVAQRLEGILQDEKANVAATTQPGTTATAETTPPTPGAKLLNLTPADMPQSAAAQVNPQPTETVAPVPSKNQPEAASLDKTTRTLTPAKFGTFLSDAKQLSVEYVSAVDAGDTGKATAIASRVADMPSPGAPELVAKLQSYSAKREAATGEIAANNGDNVGKITTGGNQGGTGEAQPNATVPKYLQDKITPEGYFTEGRYPDKSYPKNFVAKQDVPDTVIKAGDRVALIQTRDGSYEAILGKVVQDQGFSVKRERTVDARMFETVPGGVQRTPAPAPATTSLGESTTEATGRSTLPKESKKQPTTEGKKTNSELTSKKNLQVVDKQSSRQSAHEALDSYLEVPEGRRSMRSAEELTRLADKLNKAGQAGAIQRRGGLRGKNKLGVHKHGGSKREGEPDAFLALQDEVIKDPRMYATVLAHELSHAIEYKINGNTTSTMDLFGPLSKAERGQISRELKAIVNTLEGEAVARNKPAYYYNPTEMLARYVETLVLHPGRAESLAPLLTEKFEDLVIREPLAADLMSALNDSLDKGFVNKTPGWFKDLRQLYRKRLGKRAGDLAYDSEIIRRAEIGRSASLIEKLVKQKFKKVKDSPKELFHAAEAILVTEDGVPQFGTHDFLWNVKADELKNLAKAGWKVVETHELGEKQVKGATVMVREYDLARVRYTPAQAKEIFDGLSPEGQQLIKDFTAAKEEARDEFNRELMKGLYEIDSKIEGWVHHYFDGKPFSAGKSSGLKTRIAAAKKQRTGAEGYVEDFRKSITKAMLELDSARINNSFIADQLARISKPIAKGEQPEKGWVEVVADGKGGLRLPGEGMQLMIKPDEGKAVKIPERRYQVPRDLAEHYRSVRDVPEEANMAARVLNRAAKYWTLNVLIHPGSTATNFISGGLQYGAKIVNDFYLDILTANFGMDRTRRNLIAPMKVLTPKGWSNAPDWLYGGYRSTQVGQYANSSDTKIDKGLEQYGNKMLYVFSLVETYWKKTIALSEGSNLNGASNRMVTKRLQAEELQLVAELNKAIDTYAFDYDNKPLWLEKFERGGGKLAKPFMIYPYKLTKFYAHFVSSAFDQTLPWQQRVSKVLTITTIMAFIAMLYKDQEEKMKTPQGTEKTPLQLVPGARVFVGTSSDGKELFIRTAKYPFFNLTSGAAAFAHRNGTEIADLLNEQYGTVGPAADLFMLATGKRDQFSQYTPTSAILGSMTAEWIPGFRIFSDTGRALDDTSRAPKTFVQGFFSNLPVLGSEEEREKLRGDARTIKIPDETEAGRSINKNDRTVTERVIKNDTSDVLLGLLTGIYRRRIDPKEAQAQHLREIRDEAETEIRDMLLKGHEADAAAMADEYGLKIPDGTYKYYRSMADEKRKEQKAKADEKKKK